MSIFQNERDKQLKDAYTLMKNAKPDAYEQARIHYYTLKEGQGWLRTEKERLISTEIDPFLNQLTTEFKELTQGNPSTSSNTQNEIGDESETRYLKKKLMQEKDKVAIRNRLLVLGSGNSVTLNNSWLPFIFDILIAIMGITIVYLLASGKYSKLSSIITNTVYPTNNTI